MQPEGVSGKKKEFPPRLSEEETRELVLALMRKEIDGKNLMERAEEAYNDARIAARAAAKLSRGKKNNVPAAHAEHLNKVLKTLEELAEGKVPKTMSVLDYLGERIFGSPHRRADRFYQGKVITKEGIEEMMRRIERSVYGSSFVFAPTHQHAVFHDGTKPIVELGDFQKKSMIPIKEEIIVEEEIQPEPLKNQQAIFHEELEPAVVRESEYSDNEEILTPEMVTQTVDRLGARVVATERNIYTTAAEEETAFQRELARREAAELRGFLAEKAQNDAKKEKKKRWWN